MFSQAVSVPRPEEAPPLGRREPPFVSTEPVPALAGRRFVTLDAMRGVAAIAVMLFHYLYGTACTLFAHGFYAVDFFFVLSGVVLAHSYEARIQRGMPFGAYLRARLIRLYPLYAVGSALGAVVLFVEIGRGSVVGMDWNQFAGALVAAAFFLPAPNAAHVPVTAGMTLQGALFPLNIAAWSLFFELVVSFGFFIVIRKRINPWIIVTVSAMILLPLIPVYRTLNIGWGFATFAGAFPRTAFGFFAGVLIYRWFVRTGGSRLAVPPVLLLVAMVVPLALPTSSAAMRLLALGLSVLLIPSLVIAGLAVDARVERRPALAWLGRVSYGVYAIHLPVYGLVVFVLGTPAWVPGLGRTSPWFAAALAIAVIPLAHLVTATIDEPARRWLAGLRVARIGHRGSPS
jgi:peptidoglycan/LPS O-acetylase OafA/YrhL